MNTVQGVKVLQQETEKSNEKSLSQLIVNLLNPSEVHSKKKKKF